MLIISYSFEFSDYFLLKCMVILSCCPTIILCTHIHHTVRGLTHMNMKFEKLNI